MNFNVIKRAKPGQARCPLDFPTLIDVQFLSFTQNFVTSTQTLGQTTVLDSVETAVMNKICEGFRTRKFLFANTFGTKKQRRE